MKKILAVLALAAIAASAHANVQGPRPLPLVLLWSRAMALSSVFIGGGKVPHPVTIARVQGLIINGGSSGGGAGNSVLTITDGTNTCTATFACTATAAAAGTFVEATIANGAGTGCRYAANASLTSSVTTAGCTTTQPTLNLQVLGDPN
jgi:hypothetical protein